MKILIWSKINENLDYAQNCRKYMILVNIYRKISILVNIFVKIDFGQNFPQILDWVKISEKCQFG